MGDEKDERRQMGSLQTNSGGMRKWRIRQVKRGKRNRLTGGEKWNGRTWNSSAEWLECVWRESHWGKVKGSKIMSRLLSAIWMIIYPRHWQMVPKKQHRMRKQKQKKKNGKKLRAAKFEPHSNIFVTRPQTCARSSSAAPCVHPHLPRVQKLEKLEKQWCCQGITSIIQIRNKEQPHFLYTDRNVWFQLCF